MRRWSTGAASCCCSSSFPKESEDFCTSLETGSCASSPGVTACRWRVSGGEAKPRAARGTPRCRPTGPERARNSTAPPAFSPPGPRGATMADRDGRGRLPWHLSRITAPYPVRPLVVTMGLGAILPMSATVWVLSLSGVQDAYHLGLPILVLVAAQQLQLGLTLDLPVALVANRTSRSRVMVVVGLFYALCAALLWLAGIVANQALLYTAVIVVVLAAGSLTSTENALLCEYYPPSLRPRVILAQRTAIVFGVTLCPPLVAALALAFGWEVPFLVLAAAAAVFAVLSAGLPPAGTRSIATAPGAPDEPRDEPADEPATLPEAVRTLFTTPSLRMIYYSMPFLVGTVVGLSFYANQLYENVFHQDAAHRAMLFGLAEPGVAVGLLIGFLVLPKRISGDPGRALRLIATLAFTAGLAAAALALAPSVPTAFVAQMLFGAVSAVVVGGI